ncbi:MAG: aldo/keto reductase [Thermoplasmatota archaeon]
MIPLAEERVRLGDLDVRVSRVCIGTWSWGSRTIWGYGWGYTERDIREVFSTCLSAGINFFDTAELYGLGASERLLGSCLRELGGEDVVIGTKFTPIHRRRSHSIRRALVASLGRLGLRRVSLYQVHHMDSEARIPRWMEALARLRDEGLIEAIGVSNYFPHEMGVAMDELHRSGQRLTSNQVHFSLIYRKHERNGLLRMCGERGVTMLAYMPLAWGVLTGKYSPDRLPRNPIRRLVITRKLLSRVAPLLDAIRGVAAGRGSTMAQVAINWVRAKGALPIVGVKNLCQLGDVRGALDWSLTRTEVDELDRASDALGEEPLRTFWRS